jgi:UDP-3-O-acyl-N-acetylglucosamine deacetylase
MSFNSERAARVSEIRRAEVAKKARRIETIDHLMAGVYHALTTAVIVTVPPIRPGVPGSVYAVTSANGIKWVRSPLNRHVGILREPVEIDALTDGTVIVTQWEGPEDDV